LLAYPLGRRLLAFALIVLAAFACGGDHGASYSPESDAHFVESVRGAYIATSSIGEVTLLLCEDTGDDAATVCASPDIGTSTQCAYACHTIRYQNASTETLDMTGNGGCGCANADAELAITTTFAFAGGEATAHAMLQVTPSNDDPYGEPWRVLPSQASGAAPSNATASAKGFFMQDGRLVLDVQAIGSPYNLSEKLYFTRDPNRAGGECDGNTVGHITQ